MKNYFLVTNPTTDDYTKSTQGSQNCVKSIDGTMVILTPKVGQTFSNGRPHTAETLVILTRLSSFLPAEQATMLDRKMVSDYHKKFGHDVVEMFELAFGTVSIAESILIDEKTAEIQHSLLSGRIPKARFHAGRYRVGEVFTVEKKAQLVGILSKFLADFPREVVEGDVSTKSNNEEAGIMVLDPFTTPFLAKDEDNTLLINSQSASTAHIILPDPATVRFEGDYKHPVPIRKLRLVNVGGGNGDPGDIKITIDGGGKFERGNTEIWLRTHVVSDVVLGCINQPRYGIAMWKQQGTVKVVTEAERDTQFAINNNITNTVPFNKRNLEHNETVCTYTSGNTFVTAEIDGLYKVKYKVFVDSTGGDTWNLEAFVTVNRKATGNDEVITKSRTKAGNSGGEDSSITESDYIDLKAGDKVKLSLLSTNFTGRITSATLTLSVDV